jgi:hypothetical protein
MDYKPTVSVLSFGLVVSLLFCLSIIGLHVYRGSTSDYRYDIITEDFTRRLDLQNREYEVRYNRLQEQMSTLTFTTDKRIHLLEEQLQMYRNEKQRAPPSGR